MNSSRIAAIAAATAANVANPNGDPGGSKRGAIRLYLHTFAAGQCVSCGLDTVLDAPSSDPRQATIGHLSSVGNSKRGMRAGAVANQCRECQTRQGDASLVPFLTDERAARVPVEWPTMADMMRAYYAANESDNADAYRARVSEATTDLPW